MVLFLTIRGKRNMEIESTLSKLIVSSAILPLLGSARRMDVRSFFRRISGFTLSDY